ncbi:MAG: pseudomonalisin [Chloroflexota bacterium]|nr:pseudomonalisin [Chloroflexota bacterium]
MHRFPVLARYGRPLRAVLALVAGSATALMGGGPAVAAGTLPPLPGLAMPAPALPPLGVDTSALRVLGSGVLPGIGGLAVAGAPDPGTVIHVGVGLAHPDPVGEAATLRDLYDPGSPLFHHFLTPEQVAQRFGVAPAVRDALTGWLGRGGLSVAHVGGAGDYVQATGTVAQVERLFHTTLATYTAKGESFYANRTAPSVPAGLPVISVIGLNSLQRFHTFTRTSPAGPAASGLKTGQLGPQDLWSVYHQPSENLGPGTTMAIFGAGQVETVVSDLRTFETRHGFPQTVTRVHFVGAGPHDDSSGTAEWDLDSQASTGMAPLARELHYYFASSLADADVAAGFSSWVSDPRGPLQANASFGECETGPLNPVISNPALDPVNPDQNPKAQYGTELGNNLQPVAEQILAQGVLEGRTLFVSTGDTGSSCPALVLPAAGAGNGVLNQVVPFTNYPASSQYAVGVGGTVLYTDGASSAQRSLEYAWPFTGGGSALLIPAPAWQKATRNNSVPCLVDSSGRPTNTGQPCRGVPDVTAISGDAVSNGYTVIVNGRDFSGGGTSLSSPLWMGMWARIQAASTNPRGNGFADPALYAMGNDPVRAARDFHDITVGANGAYAATSGWDYVSGFGSPDVTNLMRDIDGRTLPVTATPNIGAPPARSSVPPSEGVAAITDQVTGLIAQLPTPPGAVAHPAAVPARPRTAAGARVRPPALVPGAAAALLLVLAAAGAVRLRARPPRLQRIAVRRRRRN